MGNKLSKKMKRKDSESLDSSSTQSNQSKSYAEGRGPGEVETERKFLLSGRLSTKNKAIMGIGNAGTDKYQQKTFHELEITLSAEIHQIEERLTKGPQGYNIYAFRGIKNFIKIQDGSLLQVTKNGQLFHSVKDSEKDFNDVRILREKHYILNDLSTGLWSLPIQGSQGGSGEAPELEFLKEVYLSSVASRSFKVGFGGRALILNEGDKKISIFGVPENLAYCRDKHPFVVFEAKNQVNELITASMMIENFIVDFHPLRRLQIEGCDHAEGYIAILTKDAKICLLRVDLRCRRVNRRYEFQIPQTRSKLDPALLSLSPDGRFLCLYTKFKQSWLPHQIMIFSLDVAGFRLKLSQRSHFQIPSKSFGGFSTLNFYENLAGHWLITAMTAGREAQIRTYEFDEETEMISEMMDLRKNSFIDRGRKRGMVDAAGPRRIDEAGEDAFSFAGEGYLVERGSLWVSSTGGRVLKIKYLF